MLKVITPAPTHDLSTLETCKVELEVTGSADDQFISRLIREASGEIARYCNRVFAAETVRETFRIYQACHTALGVTTTPEWCYEGVMPLQLSRAPVLEVISIIEDGTTLLPETYEVDEELGRIHRLSEGFRSGWWIPSVVVEYRAGFELLAGLPYELERCCVDLVKVRYFSRSRDPALRSERILDVIDTSFTSVSSASMKRGLPRDIAERLDAFKRYAL